MIRFAIRPAYSALCAIALFVGALIMPAGAARGACAGDCDASLEVTVDEIITMVNIALGTLTVTSCQAGDVDHSGDITVDEIVSAVNNALNGCSSGMTPTPAPTATATPTGGTGGELGTRRFTINAAKSPFTAVLSSEFALKLGSGFKGQTNGQTGPAYLDLRAGAPDANGFAYIDIVGSSDYIFVDARPTAQLVLCIKPLVPITRAGVIQCNGGLDFSLQLLVDHHLGQVGVDRYTAKDCLSACDNSFGCPTIESPNQVCNAGLIGEQCRTNSDCNSSAAATDGVCGLGRHCVSGNVGESCQADANCAMGATAGTCSQPSRCSAGKSGTCRDDADCDTTPTALDGVCGNVAPHPGVCNSAIQPTQLGGDSGLGAVDLAPVPQFGLNGLAVQITLESAPPCGDEGSGMETPFPLTTATVRAKVMNFGNADRTCSDGTPCAVDADCAAMDPPGCGTNLVYDTTGENFSCTDWQNPSGPGCFVLSTPLLDGNPMGGDLVSAFKFCGH